MDGVARHVANHVLGVVNPVLLNVAFGQPSTRAAVDGGLRLIETAHVGESGGGIIESALVELRTAHQHPRFPQKWVVFLAVEPFEVALGLAAFLCPFGSLLDAMQFDSLLTFLDGFVEVALSDFLALLVSNRIEGDDFGEVVPIAVLFFQRAVDIRQSAVIIRVITGIERVPPTTVGGVLVCRTTCCQPGQNQQQEHSPYGFQLLNALLFL